MQVAILTFDGFNELDTFAAVTILNRMKARGWVAYVTAPTEQVTSMNGVAVERQKPLEFAGEADAVLIGSGVRTRAIAADDALLSRIVLDPSWQLIGAQCSGTLLLAKLGLIGGRPACTDLTTRPWLIEAGVDVVDAPFIAHGNIATAGGCLSFHYLAAWMIALGTSLNDAAEAVRSVAPVGEEALYIDHALTVIGGAALLDETHAGKI